MFNPIYGSIASALIMIVISLSVVISVAIKERGNLAQHKKLLFLGFIGVFGGIFKVCLMIGLWKSIS